MPTRPRATGFTLVEVMAAVLVLGLLYTVLASSYIDAVSRIGTSRRSVYASLLADQALAGLEEQLAIGVAPEVGHEERDADPYTVVVDVTPLDIESLVPAELLTTGGEPGGEPAQSILDPEDPRQARLRRVDIRVTWEELGEELAVRRSTVAFDSSGLAGLLPGSSQTEGGGDDAVVDAVQDRGTGDDGEFSLDDALREFQRLQGGE